MEYYTTTIFLWFNIAVENRSHLLYIAEFLGLRYNFFLFSAVKHEFLGTDSLVSIIYDRETDSVSRPRPFLNRALSSLFMKRRRKWRFLPEPPCYLVASERGACINLTLYGAKKFLCRAPARLSPIKSFSRDHGHVERRTEMVVDSGRPSLFSNITIWYLELLRIIVGSF